MPVLSTLPCCHIVSETLTLWNLWHGAIEKGYEGLIECHPFLSDGLWFGQG